MNYTFPFTAESVRDELYGVPMVLAKQRDFKGNVEVKYQVSLGDYMQCFGNAKFDVKNGEIIFYTERDRPRYRLNMLAVERTIPFICGEDQYELNGCKKVMLYPRLELGTDSHVVISSHIDYEQDTLPRLIRSLKREGFTRDNITVVVGGVTQPREIPENTDYNRLDVPGNLMGLTGLIPLFSTNGFEPKEKYILLLHDTCEVMSGFGDAIKTTDVGLPYELITINDDRLREIGLWSMEFISQMRSTGISLTDSEPYKIFEQLKNWMTMWRSIGGVIESRSKDVYGTGVNRQVIESDSIPFKKYVSNKKTNGKP